MSSLLEYVEKAWNWVRRRGSLPDDPWSRVREPVRCGPSSRSGGVALDEPAPRRVVNLFGRRAG